MKLDIKDYQIMLELNKNCRQPVSNIAKKLMLSKDSVIYRIDRLEKQGYIQGYDCYVNSGKLGYTITRINLKLQNVTPEIEDNMILFIKNYPKINFLASVEGNIDFIICLLWKSPRDLDLFWTKLHELFGKYIQFTEVGIYSKILHYPRTYFVNELNKDKILFGSVDVPEFVDELDLKLISLLQKNSRLSIVMLAKELSMSTKTISNRLKDLERREIITGYCAVFDTNKLGYLYYKIYLDLYNTTDELIRKLDMFITAHPNIIYRDYVIGGHSCEIEIQVKDAPELHSILNQLKKEFSSIIRDHEVLQYYKEHKLFSHILN